MILSSLAHYYQRLADTPDAVTGFARVPSYGFSDEKISYVLVLSRDGQLLDVNNIMDTSGEKPQPKLVSVPRPEKRTSGIKSNFLWDKTAYVLGVEGNKDKKTAQQNTWIVTQKISMLLKTCILLHLPMPTMHGLQAMKIFLQNWQPEQFNQSPCSPKMIDANLVFKLDGETQFLHQRTAAKNLWAKMVAPEDDAATACLSGNGRKSSFSALTSIHKRCLWRKKYRRIRLFPLMPMPIHPTESRKAKMRPFRKWPHLPIPQH